MPRVTARSSILGTVAMMVLAIGVLGPSPGGAQRRAAAVSHVLPDARVRDVTLTPKSTIVQDTILE